MRYLLNLVYVVALVLATPWLVWASIRTGKYRAGFAEKFLGHVPRADVTRQDSSRETCIWVHAVSVGEVNVAATILERLRDRLPDARFVITTTTVTGLALAKQRFASDIVSYAPLDFSWAIRSALRRFNPDLLVLIELEFWPNLITETAGQNVPVAIVNGRLSASSFGGYSRVRWLFGSVWSLLAVVLAQNDEYAERFRQLGVPSDRVVVTGSTKFDGAQTDRDNERTLGMRQLAQIQSGERVFMLGSTQAPEESLGIAAFRSLADVYPGLRLVIVPRHQERFEEVAQLLEATGLPWTRRSELEPGDEDVERILLVDTIGELSAWWGIADVAYVGGSMGDRGGQNMIEPAAYGAAVCFGPNTKNFRDVTELLISQDAAMVVHNGEQLQSFLTRCLEDADYAARLGTAAQQAVLQGRGALPTTIEQLVGILE